MIEKITKDTKPEDIDRFHEAIEGAMGKPGTCRRLVQITGIEIIDIEESTDRQDIEEALYKEFSDKDESSIEVGRWGTASARARLPYEAGDRLIKKVKLKIGWINYRVRQRLAVQRCYKCYEFGHVRLNCQGLDRTELYMTYGKSGHKARVCTEESNCIVCLDNSKKLKHYPGARGCCQATKRATALSWKSDYYK